MEDHMKPKPVGILGGMGPEATLLLQRRIIEAVPWARDDGDHIPLIVDMNTQVPSRIAYLIENKEDDPAPILVQMAQRLEQAGAIGLAMPCNTAHVFKEQIEKAVQIPLLDMVRLACERAASLVPKGERIGLLASPALKRLGLFEKTLSELGCEVSWPKNEYALLDTIKMIKANGPTTQSLTALRHASKELKSNGSNTQLIACSEFSLHSRALSSLTVNLIDTLDCLVDAIVEQSRTKQRI